MSSPHACLPLAILVPGWLNPVILYSGKRHLTVSIKSETVVIPSKHGMTSLWVYQDERLEKGKKKNIIMLTRLSQHEQAGSKRRRRRRLEFFASLTVQFHQRLR